MSESIQPGALYVVSTPIGNLGDITRRAVQILSGVDAVAAEDTRTTGFLLKHLDITKPLVSYFSHNERRRIPALIERLRAGESIALVTDAGTPGISDPAFAFVREAIARGIRVIPVPGASALLPALVVSGLPTERFVFEGFLPVKKGRRKRLEALMEEGRTIVLYEAPHRVRRTLKDLHEVLGDRDAVLAREMTKKFEEVLRGRFTELMERFRQKEPRGEFVIVIAGNSARQDHRTEETTSNEEPGHGEEDDETAAAS
jgi:16S rRNA (cytidine1402-2'-O)-methyltransferase